jgi:hypothetical protein
MSPLLRLYLDFTQAQNVEMLFGIESMAYWISLADFRVFANYCLRNKGERLTFFHTYFLP